MRHEDAVGTLGNPCGREWDTETAGLRLGPRRGAKRNSKLGDGLRAKDESMTNWKHLRGIFSGWDSFMHPFSGGISEREPEKNEEADLGDPSGENRQRLLKEARGGGVRSPREGVSG